MRCLAFFRYFTSFFKILFYLNLNLCEFQFVFIIHHVVIHLKRCHRQLVLLLLDLSHRKIGCLNLAYNIIIDDFLLDVM